MKKVSLILQHRIGRNVIGGFTGHEHNGEQICLNCGRTLREIIEKRIIRCNEKKIKDEKSNKNY